MIHYYYFIILAARSEAQHRLCINLAHLSHVPTPALRAPPPHLTLACACLVSQMRFYEQLVHDHEKEKLQPVSLWLGLAASRSGSGRRAAGGGRPPRRVRAGGLFVCFVYASPGQCSS